MALSKKYKEDITACKKLASAFSKKYGKIFGIDEKQMLSNVEAQEYLGRGASVWVSLLIQSDISDKLKVDETKPTRGFISISSDINPNGVSSTQGVARTYVVHLEFKGKKRVTQRMYDDDGVYFKIYDYGTSIEQVLEKIQAKIYSLEKLITYDKLVFSDIKYGTKFDNGGGVGVSSDDLSDNEIGTGADMNLNQYGKGGNTHDYWCYDIGGL